MIRRERKVSCRVESMTTIVNSAADDSLSLAQKPFYGVCELEAHLNAALSLTQKLKKTLSSLKFLSAAQFPELEAHMTNVTKIRAELKKFHHFVNDQQQSMSQMLHNPNEYVASSELAEGDTTSCCPIDCCDCCDVNVVSEVVRRKI